MGILKRMLRKPDKPLEQIINRYNEMVSIPITEKKNFYYFSGPHNKGPFLDSTTIIHNSPLINAIVLHLKHILKPILMF